MRNIGYELYARGIKVLAYMPLGEKGAVGARAPWTCAASSSASMFDVVENVYELNVASHDARELNKSLQ